MRSDCSDEAAPLRKRIALYAIVHLRRFSTPASKLAGDPGCAPKMGSRLLREIPLMAMATMSVPELSKERL